MLACRGRCNNVFLGAISCVFCLFVSLYYAVFLVFPAEDGIDAVIAVLGKVFVWLLRGSRCVTARVAAAIPPIRVRVSVFRACETFLTLILSGLGPVFEYHK